MDVYAAMSTQRAVRRLRPDPIPHDVLERVLQAAAWAPTGGNQQPWRVVVVTDAETKQVLADLYRPEWERFSAMYAALIAAAPEDEQPKLQRAAAAGDHLAAHLHEAPAVLVFYFDPRRMAVTDSELENSVVLAESRIVGIPRLADSLLGRNTEVLRSGLRPTATRLMLGDHSHVDLE